MGTRTFKAIFSAILLAAGVLAAAPAPCPAADGIRWHAYGDGMRLGQSANKKVLINFYADWCGYCKKMDRETYRDGDVVRYLNKHFVAIRVDSERENGIAADYRVQSLPSTWFVAENGQRISNLPGFVPPDMFFKILRYIRTDSYRDMSFRKFLKK